MIGSKDPEALTEFYEKVIGKPPDWSDEGWAGWQIGDISLTIGEHSEVTNHAKEPQRIILNFNTKDVREEFARIKELGAEIVKEPYEIQSMWIATFADPDGNYFQLMTPWEAEASEEDSDLN